MESTREDIPTALALQMEVLNGGSPVDSDFDLFDIRRSQQYHQWTTLVETFYQQIRYGCEERNCRNATCRSCQQRLSEQKGRPFRVPTRATATALATALATEPNARSRLCSSPLKPIDDGDGAFVGPSPGQVIDDRSLVQQLYATKAWKQAGATVKTNPSNAAKLSEAIREWSQSSAKCSVDQFRDLIVSLEQKLFSENENSLRTRNNADACFELMNSHLEDDAQVTNDMTRSRLFCAAALLISALEPHPHEGSMAHQQQFLEFCVAVGSGSLVPSTMKVQPDGSKFYRHLHCALSRPAINCATRFFRLLFEQNAYAQFFSKVYENHYQAKHPYPNSVILVLSTWAKLVFRDNWESQAIVEGSSNEHMALKFLDELLRYNADHAWPFSQPLYCMMGLVGERIDIVKDPPKLSDRSEGINGILLLRYRWLFTQRERVVFFRSTNFHRMLRSFEQAMEANTLTVRLQSVYRASANSQARREEIFSRLKTVISQCLTLQIRRDHILEDALNHLWRRERRELLRPLKVKFTNESVPEDGVDLGGLQQEFFRLALAEALDPELGLFTTNPDNQMAWFRALSPAPLYQFALVGMLFGLAIYNGITLPVNFPQYFYSLLKDTKEPNLEDLKDGWPDVYASLKTLRDYESDDLEDVFSINKTFTLDLIGRRIELDMDMTMQFPQSMEEALELAKTSQAAEHAAMVTKSNRDDYIQTYAQWLLQKSVKPQSDAFLKGFRTLFTENDLDLLSAEDFRKMVEGERTINVAELKRVAKYEDGFHADSQTIRNFWSVVENYDQEKLRALLEFVTATDRMPVAGMQDLVFVIMKSGDGGDGGRRLPSSHTCFNRLMLPDYPSRELLEDRLQLVIQNSEGFGIA